MMIRLTVLVLSLGIVFGNDELTFVSTDCGVDIILPCTALQNCKNYTSVTWYKFYNNSSDTMTILKRSENVCDNDSVSLDKNTSLVLRKVAPSDSGIYKCFFRAKAGRNNCHTLFRLNISDCVPTPSPIIVDFSTTKFINGSSWANISIPVTHVDDSELFVFWGCVGLAVIKLVLSAMCILGIVKFRQLRRRRQT